ncbi:M23 family metallopeptidase [bacterium]|nr:M23 family metallopeptidase [bacterium]
MKKYIILFIIIVIVGAIWGIQFWFNSSSEDVSAPEVKAEELDREVVVGIESGNTFSDITENVGISGTLMHEILDATTDVYNLTKIRVGREINFYFDKDTDEFVKMVYPIDTEEELYITRNGIGELIAKRKEIKYEISVKTVQGTIDSSLYESAVEQDIDIRAIIDLAEIFAWTVDFGMGIRVGDTYKFIFEERYRDGQYVMPGRVLAAKFVNDGRVIEGYYFYEGQDEEGRDMDGYFHPDGASVQKIFLKNPVSFKYISSGYTTGPRYISAFSAYTSSHRAIDYAAAVGSPISAVGNGQIVSAGWNSHGYGNFISIRHNETFTTNYAHLQKIYVKYGQYVSQGDIIGTVGSTGYSTGPHLHYEMVKFGTKINPLTVELPSDKAVAEEKLEEFKQSIASWQEKLSS